MSLPNGYHDVVPGKIAAVVTYLEMTEQPAAEFPPEARFSVQRVWPPELAWYRAGGSRSEVDPVGDIVPKAAADVAYQNAKENTPHTPRMAYDQALSKVMQHLLKEETQVYKDFMENEGFKRFVGNMVYALTNQ